MEEDADRQKAGRGEPDRECLPGARTTPVDAKLQALDLTGLALTETIPHMPNSANMGLPFHAEACSLHQRALAPEVPVVGMGGVPFQVPDEAYGTHDIVWNRAEKEVDCAPATLNSSSVYHHEVVSMPIIRLGVPWPSMLNPSGQKDSQTSEIARY
jgi:hypothetical protein